MNLEFKSLILMLASGFERVNDVTLIGLLSVELVLVISSSNVENTKDILSYGK